MRQLLLGVLVLFVAWRGYVHIVDRPSQTVALAASATRADVSTSRAAPVPDRAVFTCDGREYCSQMRSRAEAEFFVRHCPDTKMDGDHDGEPCENDSRF